MPCRNMFGKEYLSKQTFKIDREVDGRFWISRKNDTNMHRAYFIINNGRLESITDKEDYAYPNTQGKLVWSNGYTTEVYHGKKLCPQNPKAPIKIVSQVLEPQVNTPEPKEPPVVEVKPVIETTEVPTVTNPENKCTDPITFDKIEGKRGRTWKTGDSQRKVVDKLRFRKRMLRIHTLSREIITGEAKYFIEGGYLIFLNKKRERVFAFVTVDGNLQWSNGRTSEILGAELCPSPACSKISIRAL